MTPNFNPNGSSIIRAMQITYAVDKLYSIWDESVGGKDLAEDLWCTLCEIVEEVNANENDT